MNWDTPEEFGAFFIENFITPIFKLMTEHELLGVKLYGWFFGFVAVKLAVMFFKAFFGNRDNGKE